MVIKKLKKLLQDRILILDGAMGTMIQEYNLLEKDYRGDLFANHSEEIKGLNDVLSLTKPEVIEQIHKDFLEAGADIIETNTFNATKISFSNYHMENMVYDINVASAKIAKKLADEFTFKNPSKPRFVAGSIGPTDKTASFSVSSDSSIKNTYFDELFEAYLEQIKALIKGGVDLLLIETVFDSINCKAALYAAEKVFEELNISLPIIISATLTNGNLLSGQTLEAFLNSIVHANPLAIGLNCSLGADLLYPFIKELSKIAPLYTICYPNAGLPNELGYYDETPEMFAEKINNFAKEKLINIVGGCCGTTPLHTTLIAKKLSNATPRKIPEIPKITRLSGLEPLNITKDIKFINIGERANVTGSKRFSKFIISKDFDSALEVARKQIDNGAQVIDINMDESMLDAKSEMKNFLNLISSDKDIAKAPIMVDSSKWEVIVAGLKCLPGKGIVNSISLKEGEEIFIKQAKIIHSLGAAVLFMAFDEKGQAETAKRKIEICLRAYKILTEEINFSPHDIIFDLNVFAIATGLEEHNNLAIEFLEAAKYLKANLPYCHISGGLSNLSFSFRGKNMIREAMHSIFLYHAIPCGMNFAIVNPGQIPVYDEIPLHLRNLIENVIFNKNPQATYELVDYANNITDPQKKATLKEEWRTDTLNKRLELSIIKGITKYLETDLTQALTAYSKPIEIIENPLMNGISKVGILFGDGKMVLPQLVKSARAMQHAVQFLQPHIEKGKKTNIKSNGKILIATVKGDVHDIGKNIVDVVLKCNNYEIFNLGEKVALETILDMAKKENADIIGLSGLITPSLAEMVQVAKEMEARGFTIPLLIGGAATSIKHTAIKIYPIYKKGITVYVKDASQAVSIVASLLDKNKKTTFVNDLKQKYKDIINSYNATNTNITYYPLKKARDHKPKFDWDNISITKPNNTGITTFNDFSLQEIIKNFDWVQFFQEWGFKGKYPEILNESEVGKEAKNLFEDTKKMLNKIDKEKWIIPKAIIGIFPANSIEEDIEIYDSESRNKIISILQTLRQQSIHSDSQPNYSLADFFAPKKSNINDYIGFFVLTTGLQSKDIIEDDYHKLILKLIKDCLAEGFSKSLHEKVKNELWGVNSIRPAIGYPILPDHSIKRPIFELLDINNKIGVNLTENEMMTPEASICGLYIANPHAKYFSIGKIAKDQVENYAKRRNMDISIIEKNLLSYLSYKSD
ncbi:methionine synthase [bacterium B13(2017)]|nr:methionine synthase [bacterium B13(2017)]